MTSVDRIKHICKEKKIPVSKLEKDCGFGNGYLNSLAKGTLPADRLFKVAHYLGVSMEYLQYGATGPTIEQVNNLAAKLQKLERECGPAALAYVCGYFESYLDGYMKGARTGQGEAVAEAKELFKDRPDLLDRLFPAEVADHAES